MSQPRKVTPGQTLLITRRTLMRHFLFRPEDIINQLFLYFIAFYADKLCMQISAIQVLSDHYHLVLTDVLGQLPDFLRHLHRMLAIYVQKVRNWRGAVWEPCPTSVVELRTPQAAAKQMVYTWLNAVRAGLVTDAREWPGVTTTLEDLDGPAIVVQRPKLIRRTKKNPWPDQVVLRLAMPPILAELGPEAARQLLRDELNLQLEEARAHVESHGWEVLGPQSCQAVSPEQRATSWEPLQSRNPVVAVGRGMRSMLRWVLAELREFRMAYREALEEWRKGRRDVVFPYGTWAMVKLHGARVAAPVG